MLVSTKQSLSTRTVIDENQYAESIPTCGLDSTSGGTGITQNTIFTIWGSFSTLICTCSVLSECHFCPDKGRGGGGGGFHQNYLFVAFFYHFYRSLQLL